LCLMIYNVNVRVGNKIIYLSFVNIYKFVSLLLVGGFSFLNYLATILLAAYKYLILILRRKNMKTFKRLLTSALALLMVASTATAFTGCKDDSGAKLSDDGKEIVIASWNDEFENMMNNYYLKDNPLPDGIEFKFINTGGSETYQEKLDNLLESDEVIDIFLMEADYAKKYVNSEYVVPLSEVGIKDSDLKNQYDYTKDVVRNSKGKIVGSSWQAAPGLFIYRRSLAEKFLGTSDPAEVQEKIKDWDSFVATAKLVNEKSEGKTKMVTSIDDIWQVLRTVRTAPWVKDNKINIDETPDFFMDLAKTLTDEKLVAEYKPWGTEWNAAVGNDDVFGYFGSTWFIQWTMVGNSAGGSEDDPGPGVGTYGDWAAIEGPEAYYWGGTWLAVTPKCDNKTIVEDIIRYFTVNEDSMKKYSLDSYDYVNNDKAIKSIIDDGYSFDFLGGQDHYSLFREAAAKIDTKAMSAYDQVANNTFLEQVEKYVQGTIDKDKAIEEFKKEMMNSFSELEE